MGLCPPIASPFPDHPGCRRRKEPKRPCQFPKTRSAAGSSSMHRVGACVKRGLQTHPWRRRHHRSLEELEFGHWDFFGGWILVFGVFILVFGAWFLELSF